MRHQTYSAIPTFYRGIKYRSRLEARWASMFRAWRWPARYEPVELLAYLPDFVIVGRGAQLLVEIKPAITHDELLVHCAKIDESGWRGEALLLGADVPLDGPGGAFDGCHGIGLIREVEAGPAGDLVFHWGVAEAFECGLCSQVSVLHVNRSWRCRLCGQSDGAAHVGQLERGRLKRAWDTAGEVTQWKPAARRAV